MINHSLNINLFDSGVIISDPEDAPTTNGVASYVFLPNCEAQELMCMMCSIEANAAGCEQFAAGRAPNFVLLDFVNIGQGKQAVDQLNGF